MRTIKSRGLALLIALTLVLGITTATMSTASAAPKTGSITQSVTGTVNGVTQTGTLTVSEFTTSSGQLLANGTLDIGGLTQQVAVPVDTTATAAASSCKVLNLVLGPLHLDLLGLVIDLNQVVLNITAQPGPGNLLGNLLCAIFGLLDGSANPLGGLAALLNQILGILGNI
jgi:hypothetical protein